MEKIDQFINVYEQNLIKVKDLYEKFITKNMKTNEQIKLFCKKISIISKENDENKTLSCENVN